MDRLLLMISFSALLWRVSSDCDTSNPLIEYGGNMGQTKIFPWLGVLNVYLYMDGKLEVAITGVVLIHKDFALVHADDVARIPDKVFQNNCSIMFITEPNVPWFCQPKTYHLHPEYITATYNTIALLELDFQQSGPHRLKPICWMNDVTQNSSNLFVTGFDDAESRPLLDIGIPQFFWRNIANGIIRNLGMSRIDNYDLEKVIYSVQEKSKHECRLKYRQDGLSDQKREPVHYNCYYSKTMKHSCVWENGMVLVSNATSFFNLIGLAVHGPGCMSPGRFIDLKPYYGWVSEIIFVKTEQVMRRSEDETKSGLRDVPLHEFYIKNPLKNTRRQSDIYYYNDKFDVDILGRPVKKILNSTENHIIKVYSFKEKLETINQACVGEKLVFFTDFDYIVVPDTYRGKITYKLSLSDMTRVPADCIKVRVSHNGSSDPIKNPPDIEVQYLEVLVLGYDEEFDDTPESYYKIMQKPPLYPESGVPPIPHLLPQYISDLNIGRREIKSYMLYFTFPFQKATNFSVEFYSNTKLSLEKYIWWRASNVSENKDNTSQPSVPSKPDKLKTDSSNKIELINLYNKMNKSKLNSLAAKVARNNFYKPARVTSITNSDSPKPVDVSVDPVSNSEIFNYIKESAIPRKARQYSSNSAATLTLRKTHSLLILIFIVSLKNTAYIIFNTV